MSGLGPDGSRTSAGWSRRKANRRTFWRVVKLALTAIFAAGGWAIAWWTLVQFPERAKTDAALVEAWSEVNRSRRSLEGCQDALNRSLDIVERCCPLEVEGPP